MANFSNNGKDTFNNDATMVKTVTTKNKNKVL